MMLSIRDSVEPEDSFEDQDVFPPSPPAPAPQATPITFDLPSTTSAATQPLSSTSMPTQKSKSPITTTTTTSTKRRRTVDEATPIDVNNEGDLWEFPIETPAPASRQTTTVVETRRRKNSKGAEDIPETLKTTRRSSITAVTETVATRERTLASPIGIDESHRIPRKRKLTKQIEESDTERIDTPEPEPQQDDEDITTTNIHGL